MAASNSEIAQRSLSPLDSVALRQQLPQCFDKFWVEECFNADDPVVVHVNQHVTGILEPAAYATLTCPGNRLRRRVDGGALLHPASASVINPQLINLICQRRLVTPDQHSAGLGGEFRERTAQLE